MSQMQSLQDDEESPELDPFTAHDIFLSHSGAQKGFVKDLYNKLSESFNTFFDITDHSLPLAENFPKLIFWAASTCKLAVVVLSEEFVCSRWPMIELVAFVDALPLGVKILPLFYKLRPDDLKNKDNLKRWAEAWEAHANQDHKKRIDISKWARALQSLCSLNGLIFDQTLEGEQAYLDKIVSKISKIVPPVIKFDTHHIFGKDRLRKVILDKFEAMDSREQQTVKFRASYVLGLYGMPGSGKSTMCKYLCEHFFPLFGSGNVLDIELPTNPSPRDLVDKFKELLSLTDFRDRVSLDKVSELEQLEHLLRTFQLPARRVFLVVDNIPEKLLLWNMVARIVKLRFGQGSKVILVARTIDVLRPILDSLKNGNHCICDSICVPSIDESEAVQIILQTAGIGCTLQEQRDIVLGIVRMCKFNGSISYLPLVMKIMGAMLITYNEDLEGWRSNFESFWGRVETYKEDAVKEIVGESFKALPHDGHRLLFLDVALFILDLQIVDVKEVCTLLSFMHGSTASRMEIMIKDLQRHCFLTVHQGDSIIVHDVYLGFGKSLSEGFSNCYWRNYKTTDVQELMLIEENKGENKHVRTLILEVGQGCKRVDLRGFSSLKALVVRNCKSLAVLGLAGLSSLVSLDIKNCASFQRLECSEKGSLHNVKRLGIAGQTTKGTKGRVLLQHVQEWKQVPFLQTFMNQLHRMIAPMRCNVLEVGVARQMRSLQVLNLENTGIRRLEDMGSYWPQLRDLRIIENRLEALELGNLPKLQSFFFCDVEPNIEDYRLSKSWICKQGNRRFMLQGKQLLVGCPQLRGVGIVSAFFEEGQLGILAPDLLCLILGCFYTATELPDLSSSAHTLEELRLECCEALKRVDLLSEFKNLTTLRLVKCINLVEVTTELGFLPNLRKLKVESCPRLQTLIGFDNSTMLERLILRDCSELQEIPRLSGLTNLTKLEVNECSWNLRYLLATTNLHDLMKLRWLGLCVSGQFRVSVGNVKNLEDLQVKWADEYCGGVDLQWSRGFLSLTGDSTQEPRNEAVTLGLMSLTVDNCKALSWYLPLNFGGLRAIRLLHVGILCDVACIDGIEHLFALEELLLKDLRNLSSVRGLERLICLRELRLEECPMLEELPSLHALMNLEHLGIQDCAKLEKLPSLEELGNLHCLEIQGCAKLEELPSLHALVNLEHLEIKGCVKLEKLPSLHALVNVSDLVIVDCTKLKGVEGCDEMIRHGDLQSACFDGCNSMAPCPFNDLNNICNLSVLSFKGCQFVSNTLRDELEMILQV